jgi:3-phenylpropionate/trans-cinnamate dioxygenase ferredoxin reductase component
MRRIIVVGGSLAGHQAARWLRVLGYDRELTVLGAEVHRPYDRYPLSKAYLAGDLDRSGLEIEPHDLDVRWRLGQAATGLDLAGRYVTIDEADRAHFDGLVVATGSRPRAPFSIPGEVAGVFALRTVEDATALKDALSGTRSRLVVVGGGLIGAEVASMATAAGHRATLVESAPLPTSRALGAHVAEHLRTLHVANGVRLLSGTRVRALDVHAGQVGGVYLHTGLRLDADVVVLATGTQPNVEWLHGSGLDLSNGLSCRATLHANGSDVVVGVGDVVHAPHPALDGESVRVEHWASARHQASVAAANLLLGPSRGSPQSELPTFGTTIHGAAIRVLGFPSHADDSEVVWGSIQDGEGLVAMRRRGRLVAAVAVNATDKLPLLQDRWARAGRSALADGRAAVDGADQGGPGRGARAAERVEEGMSAVRLDKAPRW